MLIRQSQNETTHLIGNLFIEKPSDVKLVWTCLSIFFEFPRIDKDFEVSFSGKKMRNLVGFDLVVG